MVQTQERIEKQTGLTVKHAVIYAPQSGIAKIVVYNCSGVTQSVPLGACLGEAEDTNCFPYLSQVKVTRIQLTVQL